MFSNMVSTGIVRATMRTNAKAMLPTSVLVGLFQNDLTLTPFLSSTDFVECDFDGYNAVAIGAWSNRTGPGGSLDASNAAVVVFTLNSDLDPAQVAYGITYTDSAGNVLAAARLEQPKSFTLIGDYLQFVVPPLRIVPFDGADLITEGAS